MPHLKSAAVLAAATTAALLTTGLLTPGTALATTTKTFQAVSGDNCRYGQTEGTLSWWSTTVPGAVDVVGSLVDRPVPTDPILICADDGRFSVAAFTAYSGSLQVATDKRRVDNGRLDFRFVLGGTASTARVDKVVVQVCRESMISPTPSRYCGPAQTYTPISTTP